MSDPGDLTDILDLVSEGLLLLRLNGQGLQTPTIVRTNRPLLAMTGHPRATLEGRSFRVLRPDTASREAFARLIEMLGRREPGTLETMLRGADGADLPVRLRSRPLASREDLLAVWVLPGALAGTGPAETETAAAARLLAGLTDECFYVLRVMDDLRLQLAWIDERVADVIGLTAAELLAQGGLVEQVADRDRASFRQHGQRLIAAEPSTALYRVRTRAGALRWLHDRARPLRGPDGLVSEVVGSLAVQSDETGQGASHHRLDRLATVLSAQLQALVCLTDDRGLLRWVSSTPATPWADAFRVALQPAPATSPDPTLLDLWQDLVEEAFRGGESVVGHVAWRAAEGPIRLSAAFFMLEADLALAVLRAADAPAGRDEGQVSSGIASLTELDLLDGADIAALLLAASGEVLASTRAARRQLGLAEATLRRVILPRLLDEERARLLDQELTRAARGPHEASLRLTLGETTPWRLRSLVLPERGRAALLIAMGGERLTGGDGLAQGSTTAGRLEALLGAVHDGILVTAADGTIRAVNPMAEDLFGRTAQTLLGTPVDRLLQTRPVGATPARPLLAELPDGRVILRDCVAVRPEGEEVMVDVIACPVGSAPVQEVVLAIRDLSARQATEETVRYLAQYDLLTGLPNRRLFEDRLRQGIEQSRLTGAGFAVLLLDLDRFSLINDSLGLSKGDQVLGAVAGRLIGLLGEGEPAARFDADEFMILLPGVASPEAAAKTAQKLLDGIRAPLTVSEHELTVGSSIGIAFYPADGQEPEALVKNAIAALTRAKEHGRNRFQFYTDDMNASAFERLMLETRLRRALEQGELVLYYQPQVMAANGAVVGAEALLRWFHPEVGLVSPADFIPLAEETGLIVPIGAWVLETACRQAQRWRQQLNAPQFRVAVNLSARQFEHPELATMVGTALDVAGLPAANLELELTESVVMREADDATRRLTELTALGVSLAIDDFGTGYSSLAYLRRFPIRSLKIDRSFTTDLERDPGSVTIAQAIVALGRSLGLRVVAEGVETAGQLTILRGFGCDELQGYHFCRPLPAEELTGIMRAGKLPRPRDP